MQKLVELLLVAPLDSDPRAVGFAQSRVSRLEHGIKEARTQGLAVHDLKSELQEAKQQLDWIRGRTNVTDGLWYGVGLNGYKLDRMYDVLSGAWPTPKDFANRINPWLDEYMARYCLARGTVVRKLYTTNFP